MAVERADGDHLIPVDDRPATVDRDQSVGIAVPVAPMVSKS